MSDNSNYIIRATWFYEIFQCIKKVTAKKNSLDKYDVSVCVLIFTVYGYLLLKRHFNDSNYLYCPTEYSFDSWTECRMYQINFNCYFQAKSEHLSIKLYNRFGSFCKVSQWDMNHPSNYSNKINENHLYLLLVLYIYLKKMSNNNVTNIIWHVPTSSIRWFTRYFFYIFETFSTKSYYYESWDH